MSLEVNITAMAAQYGIEVGRKDLPENPHDDSTSSVESDAASSISKNDDFCIACVSSSSSKDLVQIRCGHSYCSECLASIFKEALQDETAYPPRCCSPISLKHVQQHLPKPLVKQFRTKQLELSTKNKTYCHKPTCSTFIAPHSIHNDQAICQKCGSRTCTKCRTEWHFGPCSGIDDPALKELATSEYWQRCPQCRRMVERTEGCNDMTCRCGCSFCYGCGFRPHECKCTFTDDDEVGDDTLSDDTDDDDGASDDDDIESIGMMVQRHHAEEHQGFSITSEKGASFTCDACLHTYRNWIPQCSSCALKVCNRCRSRMDR